MASNAPPVATPAPAIRATGGRKRTPLWLKLILGSLALILFGGLGFGFVQIFGRVYGTELCAETLERRSFTFLEIPLIGYQIQATTHVDVSGSLEKYLATQKLVPATPAAKKTWHVIQIARGVTGVRHGEPQILCRYLDARDSESEVAWLTWTKDNPKLAPYVWQAVCTLALAGEYTAIPDLLEVTQGATDPVALQAKIKRVVQETQTEPAP